MPKDKIHIAVVDDHQLFRKGLINLIQQVGKDFKVISEAGNGKEFLAQLNARELPRVVILDVNMPVLDGFETTEILRKKYPQVGILALTMLDDEASLVKLIKAGVSGYLNKDVEPRELRDAILSVAENGTYYTEQVAGKLVNIIRNPVAPGSTEKLSEQEIRFIELCCSEDTYRIIAGKMSLSSKTIEGYRDRLFDKLHVKSRIGLVIYALKNNLVSLEQLD